jgi:hypothetical protein
LFNCNQVPRAARNHLHEALLNGGLASADSGLQLDLADRAKRCLREDPAPSSFFNSAEEKMRNFRVTKSRRLLLNPRQFVELYFTSSTILWAFCRTNRRFQFKKRSQLFICTHNETPSVGAMRVKNVVS